MYENVKDAIREVLKQDELFDLGAQVLKKNFDSLVKAGFSKKEAIAIIAGQGAIIKAN